MRFSREGFSICGHPSAWMEWKHLNPHKDVGLSHYTGTVLVHDGAFGTRRVVYGNIFRDLDMLVYVSDNRQPVLPFEKIRGRGGNCPCLGSNSGNPRNQSDALPTMSLDIVKTDHYLKNERRGTHPPGRETIVIPRVKVNCSRASLAKTPELRNKPPEQSQTRISSPRIISVEDWRSHQASWKYLVIAIDVIWNDCNLWNRSATNSVYCPMRLLA